MRNGIILGSGRSGTSMVAGSLAGAGYEMGGALHPARASNPKGFFEAVEVNAINEAILAPVLGPRPALTSGQRWLGIPDAPVAVPDPAVSTRIRRIVERRPFCFKDPRFCFTLPAWHDVLSDPSSSDPSSLSQAGFVCVFRQPALTAASIVEECRRADYLRSVEIDATHALALWTAMYRKVTDLAGRHDWLFLHYDQMLTAAGRARLSDFLDAPVADDFADRWLRRPADASPVASEVAELYAELCDRAHHRETERVAPTAAASAKSMPLVSVIVPVADGEEADVADAIADLKAQRGVCTEIILADLTRDGLPPHPEVAVSRTTVPSRGAAIRNALHVATAELVALQRPGCRALPSRLAHAVAVLEDRPGTDLVTCAHHLHDEGGQFVELRDRAPSTSPEPFWESGIVARRHVLEGLATWAFHPVELELVTDLHRTGRAAHLAEPGFSVSQSRHDGAVADARHDRLLVELGRKVTGRQGAAPVMPELTVSVCTFDRSDVLRECLEGFARQLLAPGSFELVVVNDGSTDATAALLDGLDLRIPTTVIHQENRGLASARNTGMHAAKGRLILFANDDTIPMPDCVGEHLRAHRDHAGSKVAVLGTFEQPPDALENALMRYLETSSSVFGYAQMTPQRVHDAFRFMTCNISVALDDVRRVGGFDPSFRHYGCEDTDLGFRLAELGYGVLYEPAARALHRHPMSFDQLAARQRTVAAAYVRLFRKHPHALAAWGLEELSENGCRQARAAAGSVVELETLARTLAAVNVRELASSGRGQEAEEVLVRLAEVLPVLERVWWWEGYRDGFAANHLSGFGVLAGAEGRHGFSSARPRRVLAWPRWEDTRSLGTLLDLAAPLLEHRDMVLVLRHDPRIDGDQELAVAALTAAFAERFTDDTDAEILLETAPLGAAAVHRLGRSVDAFVRLGHEPDWFADAIVAETLADPTDVADWRARFGATDAAPGADVLLAAEGMIGLDEARHLHDLAQGVRSGCIVEVGSYRGRSTTALGLGSMSGAGVAVFAVDPHEEFTGALGGEFGPDDRRAFFQTMLDSGCHRVVRLVNLTSEIVTPAWQRPVGLLFIDGDHTYRGVRRDYECWAPHLVPDAIVAFDDSTDPDLGPWQLLEELVGLGVLEPVVTVGRIRTFRHLHADAPSVAEDATRPAAHRPRHLTLAGS